VLSAHMKGISISVPADLATFPLKIQKAAWDR
jgi:hypothetical protein